MRSSIEPFLMAFSDASLIFCTRSSLWLFSISIRSLTSVTFLLSSIASGIMRFSLLMENTPPSHKFSPIKVFNSYYTTFFRNLQLYVKSYLTLEFINVNIPLRAQSNIFVSFFSVIFISIFIPKIKIYKRRCFFIKKMI